MSELHKFLGKIKEVAQTTEGFISQKVEAMIPSVPNPENNNLDSSRFKQVWNQIETAPYHNKNHPLDQAHIQHQDASKTASVSSTEKEEKPASLILQIRYRIKC